MVLYVQVYMNVCVFFFSENLGPGFDDGCDGCEFKNHFRKLSFTEREEFSISLAIYT